MPNEIYWHGNSLAAFSRDLATTVDGVTTAGRFDSTYVSNCISIPGSGFIRTGPFIDAASTTDIKIHGEFYSTGITASNIAMYVQNSVGTRVIRLFQTSSTNLRLDYWNGSAWVTLLAAIPFSANTLYQIDVHLTAGASGTAHVYLGGSLIASDTSSGMNAAVTNFAAVEFGTPHGSTCFWSQIMVSNFDMRNDKYFVKSKATGNGSQTDGTGDYTTIDEDALNESDLSRLTGVGDERTFTHGGITLPAGFDIRAACLNGRMRVTGATVGDGQLEIISGGTPANSPDLNLANGFEPRGYHWTTDPDTASAWDEAGYDAVEFGFKAVA